MKNLYVARKLAHQRMSIEEPRLLVREPRWNRPDNLQIAEQLHQLALAASSAKEVDRLAAAAGRAADYLQ